MKNAKLTQAWVSRVTSGMVDDIDVSGREVGRAPSDAEISDIVTRSIGTNAFREMVRRKWFLPLGTGDRRTEHSKALQMFLFPKESSRPAFEASALFRRQSRQSDLVEEITTHAWLCHVADKATATKKLSFDASRLNQKSITHLVHLSNSASGPRDALDYLEKLGIKVVIESSLPGMRADGASFVASNFGPVIALTLRYDRLDSFWFTLLHELAHIILHLRDNSDKVFVDSIEDDDLVELDEVEAEANAFAKDAFVPRDAWLRSDAFRFGTESAIIALAKKFEIHPAVVAGRLRFERKRYQAFSQLLGVNQVRAALISE